MLVSYHGNQPGKRERSRLCLLVLTLSIGMLLATCAEAKVLGSDEPGPSSGVRQERKNTPQRRWGRRSIRLVDRPGDDLSLKVVVRAVIDESGNVRIARAVSGRRDL